MSERVTRFGVSLPKTTVKQFDEAIASLGYTNRSKAISDAVKEFITHRAVEDGKRFVGSISYLYDPNIQDVNHKLAVIQQSSQASIKAAMRSNISPKECVEVLIFEADAKDAKELFGRLSSIRGIQNCKLSALTTD